MKKSIYIIISAAAAVGLAAILIKKKNKANIKITCQCCRDSGKTEQAVTSEEIKEGETVEVALPENTRKSVVNIGLNNASIGNVAYNITLK